MQQVDSLVVRTHNTPFHADLLTLRASILAEMSYLKDSRGSNAARRILEIVAKKMQVGVDDILGESRKANIAIARQVAAFVLLRVTRMSQPEIGRVIGYRDHTPVNYARNSVQAKMKVDPGFARRVEAIVSLCAYFLDEEGAA